MIDLILKNGYLQVIINCHRKICIHIHRFKVKIVIKFLKMYLQYDKKVARVFLNLDLTNQFQSFLQILL